MFNKMLGRVSLIVLFGALDILLLGKVIWGPTGIMEYQSLNRQYASLKDKIATLDASNMALSRDIRLMQSDSRYAEKMVRQKLHYLRDNEMVYLFANPDASRVGAASNDGKN